MRSEWERDAQRCANGLLHRFGVRDAAHIRVESFAAKLGVEIVEAPLDGASAQLIHNGKRALIMVSDRIVDPLARRFSIAHELGHFVMRHLGLIHSRGHTTRGGYSGEDGNEGTARDARAPGLYG